MAAGGQPAGLGDSELAQRATIFAPGLLAGRRVLVSGGGSGIGRVTAWLCARLGAEVLVTGRDAGKLERVAGAIAAAGLAADCRAVDIRDAQQVDDLFAAIAPVDILVNSAGGQFPQPALEHRERGWHSVIDTNLNGTWRMMQRAARQWRTAGRGGSIVNLVVVNQGLFGVAHTSAARAGVIAFSEKAAVEWAPLGIRVNCIAPGAIETEGWAVYDEDIRRRYPRSNPLMRAGSPWEIAEACVFLAGPGGGFITGETLVVDGGGRLWGEIWSAGKPEYYASASRLWDDAAD